MLLSTEFASESDLLDRVMEQGIVVEAGTAWNWAALI